jgi:MFS family permease
MELLPLFVSHYHCSPRVWLRSSFAIFHAQTVGVCMSMCVQGKATPEQGGVGFQPQQIGLVLTITAVFVMFYQPCIFPRISNGLGVVRMVQMGGSVAIVMLFGFPFMTLLAYQPVLLWGAFTLQRLMDIVAGTAQMMGSGLLLINASDPAAHGRIQGFTQAMASILRTIFPAVGGALWSACLPLGYPWSPHVTYMLAVVLQAFCLCAAFKLPKELDRPKKTRTISQGGILPDDHVSA